MPLPRPQSPDPEAIIVALNAALDQIERCQHVIPQYTNALTPTATSVKPGTIIFVPDHPSGLAFRGSDGTNWVALG